LPRIGTNVGRAVEHRARRAGYFVVDALCGHGAGRHVHESPNAPNRFDPHKSGRFWEGLVMTIEPFLTTRATRVYEEDDGWNARATRRQRGRHDSSAPWWSLAQCRWR
jgi:methionyl aminopeptidase